MAGESSPAARKQQLAELERDFNLQLNQAQRTAQNELSVYRQRLIQRFRDEVVPLAQEAASQRGLGVVLTKNDTVLLAFDDAHDITAAVVAKLRARRAAAAAAVAAATAATANGPSPPATHAPLTRTLQHGGTDILVCLHDSSVSPARVFVPATLERRGRLRGRWDRPRIVVERGGAGD